MTLTVPEPASGDNAANGSASRRGRTLMRVLGAQRRFTYLAVTALSVAGVWAALHLPSAIYPELEFPRISIVAQGSALGARQMVFSVTRPLEEAVSVVPGVERVNSRSIRGGSEISLVFAPNTDMVTALQLVQSRVNQAEPLLPPGVTFEVERLTPSLFPILSYNLEGGDPATLYDIARYDIKPVLSRIPGVGRVDVQGTDVHEFEVIADPSRLAAQGLSYDDLANAIRRSTSTAAVGRVAENYQQYLIVTAQEAHSADDIANVMVAHGMRVRDFATVTLGTEDHVRIMAGDGKPAALISVTRQVNGNTVALADSVASAVASLRHILPAGTVLRPVYDQAALVREAVASVRDAMLIGAVLAVLVLFAFLRKGRITAISATSIPLTLAITVFVMQLVGQTFNLMTLGAMAIAIGLVIDDAVVITENIARHRRLAPDRRTTIRDAVQELILPVTTSTITTVVVFLPLGLLTGVVGQFFKALSITLTIAILISLVLAITIIPLLCEQFLPPESDVDDADPADVAGHGVLHKVLQVYQRALHTSLAHPRWVVGVAVALLLAGGLAYRFSGTGFLPEMDEGAFVLDYVTPGGTALAETDRQLKIVEGILAHTPEVESTSRRTGAEMGFFATEQNTGDIVVRLRPRNQRSRDVFAVIEELRGKLELAVPRMRVEFVQILTDVLNDLSGTADPVEIKLFGEQLDTLEHYAEHLAPKLADVEGIEDLYDGVSEPSAELMLHVHETEANRIGLTPEQVGAAVAGPLLGVPAGEVRGDARAVGIRVRAPDAIRFDAHTLGSLPIYAPQTGAITSLSALADLTPMRSRAELKRENQQQMIALTAEVAGVSLGDVIKDVKQVLADNAPPNGVRVEIAGQYASQQEAFRALLIVLALATLSVVAVMVIQFESFVEPLVVVLAAPMAFVGALVLLLLTGTALNVSSFMGLILLVGLIVKNGIILLDFTRHRMATEGVTLAVGLQEAAATRLRPILMTTLCTLFGLLPLALGLGAGSELQRPLALAVIGGLALSTPITLLMVPSLLVAIRGRDYTLSTEQHRDLVR